MCFLLFNRKLGDIRSVLVLVAFAFAMLASHANAAGNREGSVIGKWRITAALDGSKITALDENEAKRFVGEVMTIREDRVQLGARKCLPPELHAMRVEPTLYLREQAHADAAQLHLPNPVTVVNLGCTIAFIKGKDRIVVHWDGWFFDAIRQR